MFIKSRVVLGLTSKDGRCPIFPGCIAEVDDAEGKSAVESGYAWEITAGAPAAPSNVPSASKPSENPTKTEGAQNGAGNAENGQVTGHLDSEQLQEMSFADLKALAKDMGIETGKIRSRAGMIDAITAVEVSADDQDSPPVFDAQEVIE